ncbi:phenylalanine transporter [Escherichia coli]|uniref:Phenylalanine transporter n=1 Tax=Escherichia coli TaxID=562 RepID=A0A376UG94_ECOLX|nr:phenylalanine transporter [Escherichia coli]
MPLNKKDTQGKGVKNASTVSEDTASNQEPTLHRGLHNRHIQLIALVAQLVLVCFLALARRFRWRVRLYCWATASPGSSLSLIMRQLGEMVVEEPVSGSFAHFAYKYWGPFAGFLSGWNYWVMFVLVGMAELTAAGIYMQYWFPDVPTWIWAAGLLYYHQRR